MFIIEVEVSFKKKQSVTWRDYSSKKKKKKYSRENRYVILRVVIVPTP